MITDYRKYLLVGPSCSGKSVLLASILSNLEKDPASIWPNFKQDTGLSFKVCKYGDDVAPFPYERILGEVAQKGEWPEPTTDISAVRIQGTYPGNRLMRVKHRIIRDFVDIPGELFADFAGSERADGKKASYADWSDAILAHFPLAADESSQKAMSDYETLLNRSPTPDENEIVDNYQAMMKGARQRSRYFISPASLVTRESAHQKDFPDNYAPLPHSFRTRHPELTKIFDQRFQRYQKEVTMPLRKQIAQADGVILAVDVGWILNGGMAVFRDQHRLMQEFGHYLSHFDGWVKNLWSMAERTLLRKKGSYGRLRSIVLCGTKLDTYRPEDRSLALEALIRVLTEPVRTGSGNRIKISYTACSGIQAARIDKDKPGYLKGRIDDVEASMQPSPLPMKWPDNDWNGTDYQFGINFEPFLPQNMLSPPAQINLKQLIEQLEGNQ